MDEIIRILLSLILAATGVAREADPELSALAEARAEQVVTNFSHDGQPCCWEVLAWNAGSPDPVGRAVEQWRGSPTHWAILSDPTLTRIGCGHAQSGDAHYFACLLDRGPARTDGQPPADNRTSSPAPEPVALPDTSMAP